MNVVITVLFTKNSDPSRSGYYLPTEVATVQELLNSLRGCEFVVLHDKLDAENRPHVTFERVDSGTNVYFQRWIAIKDWIEKNPEVDKIWCVDGTDVTMLHSPFDEQQDGILYVGSEPKTMDFWWFSHFHPSIRSFIEGNGHLPLFNCGLVGGDRNTVLAFLTDFIAAFPKATVGDLTDMGAFNRVLYTAGWASRVITGEKVHTVFCAMDYDNKVAWWRHK